MIALAGPGALRSMARDMMLFLAANIDPPQELAAAVKISHEIHGATTP